MSKSYKEGNGWAFRLRSNGQDIYKSKFKSEAAARKEMAQLQAEIDNAGKAVGEGPFRTSVAVAFSHYARERLSYLKGAPAESVRINRYLRALNLPIIKLVRIAEPGEGSKKYWDVKFVRENERTI